MISTNGDSAETRVAKALAHPLRARILQLLGQREASPGELAVELGAPLGVVSYHFRMLRDYECVTLVRTEPRRGALQHFYRATERPELGPGAVAALPAGLRGELNAETLRAVLDDYVRAAEASPDGSPGAVRRSVVLLDRRAAEKVRRLLNRAHEQVRNIADEAAARGAQGRVALEVALVDFERAPGGAAR